MYRRLAFMVFGTFIFLRISLLQVAVNHESGSARRIMTSNDAEELHHDPHAQPYSRGNSELSRKPNCGFSKVNCHQMRIVGGVSAKPGEFPWMVNLGYTNPNDSSQPRWLCGGTLISDRHVLTAAHCVSGRADLYVVRVGDYDLTSNEDGARPQDILLPMDISSTRVHENYNPANYANDIAILKLLRRVFYRLLWPICLPVDRPLRTMDFVGFKLVVAGWGSTKFNGTTSPIIQYVELPVVSTESCQKAFVGQNVAINERTICAGYARGGKDACQGDSGGPLMVMAKERHNVRVTQIGIVSSGHRCGEPRYPGVYTRVAYFIDWIERNMI